MSELRDKIQKILRDNIDTGTRSAKDVDFILQRIRPTVLDELEQLIQAKCTKAKEEGFKEAKKRMGELSVGFDSDGYPDFKEVYMMNRCIGVIDELKQSLIKEGGE